MYQSLMSAERVEESRELFQTRISGGVGSENTVAWLGLTLRTHPDVMTPCPVSPLFGGSVFAEVKEGDRVLDMGTGVGSHGILAAGRAREVVAVDFNPYAVEVARANAEANGVADRVKVMQSDLFENVEGLFDLIVFPPPFLWFDPTNLAEAATTDKDYTVLRRFFSEARRHLTPTGRMLMFFSTVGDIDYFKKLSSDAGFQLQVVFTHSGDFAGTPADFISFRLS
jgi:release factor glutamine methyltransferase